MSSHVANELPFFLFADPQLMFKALNQEGHQEVNVI